MGKPGVFYHEIPSPARGNFDTFALPGAGQFIFLVKFSIVFLFRIWYAYPNDSQRRSD